MNVEEVFEETTTSMATPATKVKRNTGKASRLRKTTAFRERVEAKQLKERRESKAKRLGVFDDTALELEKSLENMALDLRETATSLPVATRGVGFAVVAEYSRLCATWTTSNVQEICTIHQYYGMVMHLVNMKMYYASSVQGERPSFDVASSPVIGEEIRQVMFATTEAPASTCNILNAIGKVTVIMQDAAQLARQSNRR